MAETNPQIINKHETTIPSHPWDLVRYIDPIFGPSMEVTIPHMDGLGMVKKCLGLVDPCFASLCGRQGCVVVDMGELLT